MTTSRAAWVVTWVIWLAGAGVIWFVWELHPASDLLDTVWGFALYLAAFFYIFTVPKLRDYVGSQMQGAGSAGARDRGS